MLKEEEEEEEEAISTPIRELKRRMQEVFDRAEVRIAITEVPGNNIKPLLQRSDPFRSNKCRATDDCLVCKDGEGGRYRTTFVYIYQ